MPVEVTHIREATLSTSPHAAKLVIDTPVLMAGQVAAAARRDWDIRFVGAYDISGDAPTPVHSLATGATDMTSMRSAIAKYLDTAADWRS